MFLSYKGAQSKQRKLPGGGPQGAFLGGIIFILKFNKAFLRPPIPKAIKGPVHESKSKKVKYVDDWPVAVGVNLKKCLVSDSKSKWQSPLNYRERTEHILPDMNNLLVLSDDVSWHKNTQFIWDKTRIKLWIIRRMVNLDLNHDQLFDVCCKEVSLGCLSGTLD